MKAKERRKVIFSILRMQRDDLEGLLMSVPPAATRNVRKMSDNEIRADVLSFLMQSGYWRVIRDAVLEPQTDG